MPSPLRGRLLEPSAAPPHGESTELLVRVGGSFIEQILSGVIDEPVGYDQDHDEWVIVVAGAAELEVNCEPLSLVAGDWVFLPRNTPHRLTSTTAGTSWLAVHLADQSVVESGDSPRGVNPNDGRILTKLPSTAPDASDLGEPAR